MTRRPRNRCYYCQSRMSGMARLRCWRWSLAVVAMRQHDRMAQDRRLEAWRLAFQAWRQVESRSEPGSGFVCQACWIEGCRYIDEVGLQGE